MKNQSLILIAILALCIPVAFLGGKGCAPQTVTERLHDTTRILSTRFIPNPDSTPVNAMPGHADAYTVTATPAKALTDSSHLEPLTAFSICGGARLPFGDSADICLTFPQKVFTIERFISDRIVNLPQPRPGKVTGPIGSPLRPFVVESPPLHTLFYLTGATSTRDFFMAGGGMEVTASSVAVDSLGNFSVKEKMRVASELMLLPKPPWAFVGVKVYYFF